MRARAVPVRAASGAVTRAGAARLALPAQPPRLSLLSLISVIAIGGVVVGVSALIVIMGVMNGLQKRPARQDPRRQPRRSRAERTATTWMRATGSRCSARVRSEPGVVAAAPVRADEGARGRRRTELQRRRVRVGIEPAGRRAARRDHRSAQHAVAGDFRFRDRRRRRSRGAVLGKRLAEQLERVRRAIDSITLTTVAGRR